MINKFYILNLFFYFSLSLTNSLIDKIPKNLQDSYNKNVKKILNNNLDTIKKNIEKFYSHSDIIYNEKKNSPHIIKQNSNIKFDQKDRRQDIKKLKMSKMNYVELFIFLSIICLDIMYYLHDKKFNKEYFLNKIHEIKLFIKNNHAFVLHFNKYSNIIDIVNSNNNLNILNNKDLIFEIKNDYIVLKNIIMQIQKSNKNAEEECEKEFPNTILLKNYINNIYKLNLKLKSLINDFEKKLNKNEIILESIKKNYMEHYKKINDNKNLKYLIGISSSIIGLSIYTIKDQYNKYKKNHNISFSNFIKTKLNIYKKCIKKYF